MKSQKIFFAGEHNAGLHPNVIKRISKVNDGKVPSYGGDDETKEMKKRIQELIGKEVVTFTFNTGTAANVIGIAALTKPYNTVICARSAHIYTYEAGALTRFAGVVNEVLSTKDGKITIDQLKFYLSRRTKENIYSQPKVVFITQPTEYGTLYSIKELTQLSQFCKSRNLYMFMDGARIANAVSKLNVDIKEITKDIGIDAFTWGGVKNGGLADVLVISNPELAKDIQYVYKQFGQDCAKSRFYSATVNALLDNDIWIENAKKANDMASKLFNKIKDNPNLEIVLPVKTNFIWAKMEKNKVKKLNEGFVFYEEVNDLDIQKYKDIPFLSRLLTNWATTNEEVDKFANAINNL